MSDDRQCLKCHKDLSDTMGCYVFTVDHEGKLGSVPGLLCVEHGANGANTLGANEYAALLNK